MDISNLSKRVRHIDPEKKKRQNQFSMVQQLLRQKKFEHAEEYARHRGFTVEDVRKASTKRLPKPPAIEPAPAPATEPAPAAAPSPNPVQLVNGWPVETEAEIWRGCRNKRLVVIQLPDGREASMWRGQRNWRFGVKVHVVLDSASGDPYYFPKQS